MTIFVLANTLLLSATLMLQTVRPVEELYAEKLRPQFHFTSSRDWINDPNGLVFYDGEYHLFFQRVPGSTDGNTATKAWGHAISTDLVHWKQLDDAISPDADGSIWSGSAVVDWKNTSGFGVDGKPPLIAAYTNARDPFDQRLAFSNDRGRTWTKFGLPVVPNLQGHNRDPKIIWHEPTQRWVMVLYLDQPHRFVILNSPDLKSWQVLQEFTLDNDDECPDFFPLSLDRDPAKQKWIFTAANGRYVVGSFDGKRFNAETDSLESDHGPGAFYAAQTYSDIPADDGRRVQVGWLRGEHLKHMPFNQQLSFPCELTLRSTPRGPRLYKWPVKEIASLYGESQTWRDLKPATVETTLQGELLDIDLDIATGPHELVTIRVRGFPIVFQPEAAAGSLTCFGRRVSLLPHDGELKLRLLVDRTSIEVFANDGETVLSGCFVPEPGNDRLTISGGGAKISSLTIHQLNSAWPQPAVKENR